MGGGYIFSESYPTNKYYSLGWLTKIASLTGTYIEFRLSVTRRAKKKYPNCDTVIFQFGNDNYMFERTVEVIKLMD